MAKKLEFPLHFAVSKGILCLKGKEMRCLGMADQSHGG